MERSPTRRNSLLPDYATLECSQGRLVGICMDRSIEMVVALLATFRAGAAYLPLDPAFPKERIDFMQQDARPLVMLTQSHLREKCSATTQVVCLDVEEVSQGEANLLAESLPPELQVWTISRTFFTPPGPRENRRACKLPNAL